jgi:hypothetical protein
MNEGLIFLAVKRHRKRKGNHWFFTADGKLKFLAAKMRKKSQREPLIFGRRSLILANGQKGPKGRKGLKGTETYAL